MGLNGEPAFKMFLPQKTTVISHCLL